MRTILIAGALALVLGACTGVTIVPVKSQGGEPGQTQQTQIDLTVTAAGSALVHDPETLIDRAVKVGKYACCRVMNKSKDECSQEPRHARGDKVEGFGPVEKGGIVDIAGKVQKIAASVKPTLELFGRHSLAIVMTCD